MENLALTLRQSADALAVTAGCAAEVQGLDDTRLVGAQALVGAHRRVLDSYAALIAAEIARRSRRDLGYAGLAQREGYGSPEALIQQVSQSSRREAAKFVAVGTIMADTQAAIDAQNVGIGSGDADGRDGAVGASDATDTGSAALLPWQAPIARALGRGSLSADAADAIRAGLGGLDDAVSGQQLTAAARGLVEDAATLSVEALHRRARAVRDELDAAGIARWERERRDQRYLKTWWQQDGMFRMSGLLDPESGLLVDSALATILSPRTGGPRFVDKAEKAKAQALVEDPRTNEQIAADALVEMVRIAGQADPGILYGSRTPAVRIIVPISTIETGTGQAFFQDHPDPISPATVERYLCSGGSVLLGFNEQAQPVDVGRNERLFTARQRIALATRDGGCRWPGCHRLVSRCEAHHINQWYRDHGRTDLAEGILLCRHHHMLLHNNGWQILRNGGHYWLRPPKRIDPRQELRAMPTKAPPIEALHPHRQAG